MVVPSGGQIAGLRPGTVITWSRCRPEDPLCRSGHGAAAGLRARSVGVDAELLPAGGPALSEWTRSCCRPEDPLCRSGHGAPLLQGSPRQESVRASTEGRRVGARAGAVDSASCRGSLSAHHACGRRHETERGKSALLCRGLLISGRCPWRLRPLPAVSICSPCGRRC